MDLSSISIGIIGAGNMGQGIIHGLIKMKNPPKIVISDPHPEKISALLENQLIQWTDNALNLINQSDVVIIAVKPQIFAHLLPQLKNFDQTKKPLILSVAAGIKLSQIQSALSLGDEYPLIRVMPNTPAMIQMGASGIYGKNLSDDDKNLIQAIVSAIGLSVWIESEEQMDVVTALSGSGPAYFFYFCEMLAKAATQLGLPEQTAKDLCLQTSLGAAKMAMQSELTLTQLREQVTSPGGTTAAGLEILQSQKLEDMLQQVIQAATKRGQALSASLQIDLED